MVQEFYVFRVTVPQWNRQTVWELALLMEKGSAIRIYLPDALSYLPGVQFLQRRRAGSQRHYFEGKCAWYG